MSTRMVILVFLLVSTALPPAAAQTGSPDTAAKASRAQKGAGVPRLYVATGPTSESDLARLRAAIEKIAGVIKVEARAEFGAVTVTIDSDGSSTQSLFAAAARSVGFVLRPAAARYYAATGPNGEADILRLRAALEKVYGVEQVELSEQADGAAVRITGVMGYPALIEAGKSAGFSLREIGSYVASGSSDKTHLTRLRAALTKVGGVEQVEMQGLVGGATLLIYGDVKDPLLTAAAKPAGYALWPLGNASGPRRFKIDGTPTTAEQQKLRQALQKLDGIGEVDIRSESGGQQVFVAGGTIQPSGILAAASNAGFTLTPVQTISLPSLTPEAERVTPPDYDNRVLEEQAVPGGPAPEFTLLGQDGKTKVSLSDYVGKKPVVLMFGSCT